MAQTQNDKYIMLTIVGGFIIAFVVNTLSVLIYPPDMSGEFPVYDNDGIMMVQFSGAFLLIALTVVAMKAEEEKQILAAAGFTAQAISFGIGFLSIFDIAGIVSFEQYEEYYRITVSSNFLYFPSLLLIASYGRFKVWVRVVSTLAGIPFLVSSLMFIIGIRDYYLLESVTNVGVALVSLTWLLWSYNIYINYKTDLLK